MKMFFIILLLVAPTFQWALVTPNDFRTGGSGRGVPLYQQQASQPEEPPMYMMNPFVSPLARKWRKLRSRRDQENRLA
ncbi:unnamed protein product [Auanema sp. JU1783]|nr:unnamed protein product [Auanema sp. JU1783]